MHAIFSASLKIVNFSEQSELGLIILPSTEKLTVLSQEHQTVARLRRASGESIRTIECIFHVNKLKLEHQDGHNPTVHAGGRLDIGVL